MNKWKFLTGKFIGMLCSLMFTVTSLGGSAKEFQSGDVVCFLGDSITHSGRYQSYILEYYASRYPERKLMFYNCGLCGDTATGGAKRLDWDLLNLKPNKTIIMLGMNDIGRYLYGKTADKTLLKKRAAAIANYKSGMRKITEKLQDNNIEIIYVTPSPYDQTAAIKQKNCLGANDALGECAEFCRQQAAKSKSGLVDFHSPMTKLNLKKQQTNPNFTLIGKDRIHPGKTGHFVMTYLFLKAQEVPGLVSAIKLNYQDGTVAAAENCKITKLKKGNKSLTFDCLENALPLPVSEEYKTADKLVPLTKDLNNEIISVTNLPAGDYELLIDGKAITKASAEAWKNGINIAILPTPMQSQAAEVHEVAMRKFSAEEPLRDMRKLEIYLKNRDNPKAQEESIVEFKKTSRYKNDSIYYSRLINAYKKNKPKENEMLDRIRELNADVYLRAKPRTHHYEIKAL